MLSEIYFDNSATTKPNPNIVKYYTEIFSNNFGNPSSLHNKGFEAEKLLKEARINLANELKCDHKQIIFTSGGTESNNLAIRGFLSANPRAGKHIITSKTEHPSVLEVYKVLQTQGYTTDFIDVDINGIPNIDTLKSLITKETSLISLSKVNNETGSVLPNDYINQIKTISKNIKIHIDAVQAFGKIIINPNISNIDLLSISAHKIHGPKGVGALYFSKDTKIHPIIWGGGQENNIRSGTQNVPGICAFAKAAQIVCQDMQNFSKIDTLNQYFRKKLQENHTNISINSPTNALPYILNVSFEGVMAEVLLHSLEQKNIYISTGSACSSHKKSRSHVLLSMGIEQTKIASAVRFSFNHYNTIEEIDICLEALSEIIPKIKKSRGHSNEKSSID